MRSFTPRELAINSAHIALELPAFTFRPFAPRKFVQAYQLRKLRELIAFAAKFVPLYREKYRAAGVCPDDLRSLEDLGYFPTVTKAEIIAAYPEGVLAPGLDPRGDVRPHLLACYPSHLRALARELGPEGCKEMGLLAISVSSELSTQRERDELGAMFGCGVYDEYSIEELTRVASQCKDRTYHLFA